MNQSARIEALALEHDAEMVELMSNLECILNEDACELIETIVCRQWVLQNHESGHTIAICFDPENRFLGKQGVHTVLDQDEYRLCERIDEACDDGFSAIYIHIDFKNKGSI